jgi:hypothetical protein
MAALHRIGWQESPEYAVKGVQHLMPFVCACSYGVDGHSRGHSAQTVARRHFAALHALCGSLPCYLAEKRIHCLHIEATAYYRHLVVIRSIHRIEAFRLIGVGE